jgi:transposase
MPTMTYPTTASEQTSIEVTGGVDTHKDTHTAAALDASGRLLGHREFAATAAGYAALLAWLGTFGQLVRVGVEGSGVYGAGLARFLQAAGVELVEVDRPDRKARRWQGKSDPVDAEAAARAAQAGRASGVPKTRGGKVDALRALRVARRSAVAARADAQRQIKALIVTAPDALRMTLRMTLRGLGDRELIAQCATRRPDRAAAGDPTVATMLALRVPARRHQQLSVEIDELDALIGPLVSAINPTLMGLSGVGTDVAGQLLVTAGDNPSGYPARRRSRCSAGPHRCLPRPGAPTATGSTAAAIARPTRRSIASCSVGCAGTPAPAPTRSGAPPKACPSPRSSAASSATSPARSTPPCSTPSLPPVPAMTSSAPEESTWSARSAARTNDVDTD